jgi:hypothetical protein
MALGEAENVISASRIADAIDEQRIDGSEQVFDGGAQIGTVQRYGQRDDSQDDHSYRQVCGTARSVLGEIGAEKCRVGISEGLHL